jgi:hypothetical protein
MEGKDYGMDGKEQGVVPKEQGMGVQEERRGKENKIEGKEQWIEEGGRREKRKGKRSRDSEKGEVDRGNEEENGINIRGWRESMRVWQWCVQAVLAARAGGGLVCASGSNFPSSKHERQHDQVQ